MPRALLAIFLSLFASAALANRTICTEDPMTASVKADKPAVAATPVVVATAPASHATVTASAPANTPTPTTATASANTNGSATHPSRPRVISPRWQSLLPGMIR